ncbi:MAG: YciI family protein [Caulobacteraceae bacterium]|nr:YciI family protein [Caulobacteraceae bacterium]
MPLFVISCVDRPGSLSLRLATREAHLAYAASPAPVRITLGGPFLDDAGDMCGTLMVVEAPDLAAAEAFAAGDPYRKADLFERVEIRAWRQAIPTA